LSDVASHTIARPAPVGSLPALGLSALGVVFGDIGTSPLYTLKTVLGLTGGTPDSTVTLGVLSLVVWTLIVVTTIKYVSIAMRVDNDGEGGIMALLAGRDKKRSAIIAFGLLGAALIYGDGAITPAISVLSALEGLSILTNRFDPYIVPLTVAVLVLLFLVQPRGSEKIGKMFGPIMAVWFVAIGLLGIWGIAKNPSVLEALNPAYGLRYLFSGGLPHFSS
jgi:KUP system potassium uptake protein